MADRFPDPTDDGIDIVRQAWCDRWGGEATETGWRLPTGSSWPSEIPTRLLLRFLSADELAALIPDIRGYRAGAKQIAALYAKAYEVIRRDEIAKASKNA